MTEEWIEEFLFRGRPPSGPDSEKDATYHVVIGQQADSPIDPTQKVRRVLGPLTVAQAEAMGWSLTGILTEINAEALKKISDLETQIEVKNTRITELEDNLKTVLLPQPE